MQETQFDRERMLLGDEAIDLLKECHVAIFGVGGVGSFAAEALARAGVGAITLVDHDTVCPLRTSTGSSSRSIPRSVKQKPT